MNGRNRMRRMAAVVMVAAVLVAGCSENPESLVTSAKEHLAKNDRNAAVIQLRNALKKNPDLAEARFLLGRTLLENGDAIGGEKELYKALELNYSADQVVPMLARLHVRRGEYKKAIEEFDVVPIATPAQLADLKTSIAQAYMALGKTKEAGAALAAALAAQPDYPLALVGEARLRAGGGDIPGALRQVESTLAKVPSLTEGWQLKADLLIAQGQVNEALAAYRKAVETKSDQVSAHSQIVMILMRQGKKEDARAQWTAMQKAAPKNPQTLYLQSLLAYGDKNYSAAREAIQLNLKAAPGNLPGLLLGAQVDYQLGSFAQSEAALVTVLQRAPRDPRARRLLVQVYLREGRPAKALEALQPLLADGQTDSDTLAFAGEVYAQNGDTAAAARYFEKSAALDPKSTGKRTAVALLHFAKGEKERGLGELEAAAAEDSGVRADLALVAANVRQKKWDAALAAVAAIEKKQPDKPMPHNLRGTILMEKRDVAGARRSFTRALALDANYFPAVANLARLDVMEKKPEDAKKRFEAALEKDPKNVQALLALAALRAQAGGSTDEVAALIAKAVVANPADSVPRQALIAHYLRNREPKKAVAAAQEAVAALPDRPEILDAAGQAYRLAGESNQAISIYNKLVQVRPESTVPFMRMAEIQIATKDNAAAIESLKKALALKPDLVEARRALIALDATSGRTSEALAAARDVQKQKPTEAWGYVLEGNIYASTKAWPEAINAYRAGLKQAGTTDLANRLYAALNAGGKASEADAFAVSWLKDHPKDRAFRHYVAQFTVAKKDYASAAKQYKALLDLEPDDVPALNNLAWIGGQTKDPKALEYAERAYKLAPANPSILDTYGVLLVEKGDVTRGVEVLQKAVAASPNVADSRLNLARALLQAGQKDAARTELDTLAKLGDKYPGQSEVAKLRGQFPVQAEVAQEKNEADRAVDALQKDVAAAPNAPAIRLKLARALIKAGKPAAAKSELETLAKLGDKFADQAEVAKLMQGL